MIADLVAGRLALKEGEESHGRKREQSLSSVVTGPIPDAVQGRAMPLVALRSVHASTLAEIDGDLMSSEHFTNHMALMAHVDQSAEMIAEHCFRRNSASVGADTQVSISEGAGPPRPMDLEQEVRVVTIERVQRGGRPARNHEGGEVPPLWWTVDRFRSHGSLLTPFEVDG